MRRYHITVIQHIEEDFDDIEAESYDEACDIAEERFRDEYDIGSWMGDYTCMLHSEEDIEDEGDDMQDIIDDDNRQRAADMNATMREGW